VVVLLVVLDFPLATMEEPLVQTLNRPDYPSRRERRFVNFFAKFKLNHASGDKMSKSPTRWQQR
jgi:hypothetical protein